MGFEPRLSKATEVTAIAGIMGGAPCVAGTRIPANIILRYLLERSSRFDIFVDYPSLPQDGIEAVARWAATQGIDVQIPVALAGDPINTLIKIDMDGAISISDLPPAGSNQ